MQHPGLLLLLLLLGLAWACPRPSLCLGCAILLALSLPVLCGLLGKECVDHGGEDDCSAWVGKEAELRARANSTG